MTKLLVFLSLLLVSDVNAYVRPVGPRARVALIVIQRQVATQIRQAGRPQVSADPDVRRIEEATRRLKARAYLRNLHRAQRLERAYWFQRFFAWY